MTTVILALAVLNINNNQFMFNTKLIALEETNGEIEYYNSDMISLTQNNFLEYSKTLEYVERNIPTEIKYEEVNKEISYGGDNTALDTIYEDILTENNKLVASISTYDEIGVDGKLYLNGEYIIEEIYINIFSALDYTEEVSLMMRKLSKKK